MEEKHITDGYLIGLDMGTSGMKCVAVNPETGKSKSIYAEWNLTRPEPGYVELDCGTVWRSFLSCVRQLEAVHGIHPRQILSIGACALCPGLIALDQQGTPLTHAIIFMDSRSEAEAAELEKAVGFERFYEITANRIMAGACSMTTMVWLKRWKPELYGRTRYFAHLPTWLGMKLTGKISMDHSNAAGTGLYDIHKQVWSPEMAELAGIASDKLPPLAQGFDLLGGLINDELVEMGMRRGLPVAVGAGDTVCTALGLGLRNHGDAFISFGTSSVITAITDMDRFDSRIANRSICENRWLLAGAMSGTGASLKWFRDAFCSDLKEQEQRTGKKAFQVIDEIAEQAGATAGGLLFLPYINGERSPVFDPMARSVALGISLGTTRGHFSRAILESAAYGLRQLLEIQESLLDVRIDHIPVAGGGSKSAVWMQIIADVLGRTIHTADTAEAGALGAALLGGIAGNLVTPDYTPQKAAYKTFCPNPALYEEYIKQYTRFLKLYPAVKGFFSPAI